MYHDFMDLKMQISPILIELHSYYTGSDATSTSKAWVGSVVMGI